MPDLTQQTCAYAGRSYLIIHAPMNRTYWFLFKAVERTVRGKDIPKYSKEQMEDLAQEHIDDKICETVTFGALYGNRIMSTLVPLEEYVFEKWHYKRIITIGDASHKVNLEKHIVIKAVANGNRSIPCQAKEAMVLSKLLRSWSTPSPTCSRGIPSHLKQMSNPPWPKSISTATKEQWISCRRLTNFR